MKVQIKKKENVIKSLELPEKWALQNIPLSLDRPETTLSTNASIVKNSAVVLVGIELVVARYAV